MNQRSILLSILPGLIVSTSFPAGYRTQTGNASKEDLDPYTFHVPVDEISFKFHAYDSRGFPLTNLTRGDLALSDNGRPQNRIVMLQFLVDLPIRAGFAFDISRSMVDEIPSNRAVISMYASRLLRPDTDRAFVMQFDTEPLITQGWTNSDSAIAAGADLVGVRPSRLVPFTAIFDSLYITCRDQWTQNREETSGNFILLFSDGLDNASHVYLSETVDMCQRAGTAIYVIVNGRKSRSSEGQRTLNDLVS